MDYGSNDYGSNTFTSSGSGSSCFDAYTQDCNATEIYCDAGMDSEGCWYGNYCLNQVNEWDGCYGVCSMNCNWETEDWCDMGTDSNGRWHGLRGMLVRQLLPQPGERVGWLLWSLLNELQLGDRGLVRHGHRLQRMLDGQLVPGQEHRGMPSSYGRIRAGNWCQDKSTGGCP